jgi:hypothetical protein
MVYRSWFLMSKQGTKYGNQCHSLFKSLSLLHSIFFSLQNSSFSWLRRLCSSLGCSILSRSCLGRSGLGRSWLSRCPPIKSPKPKTVGIINKVIQASSSRSAKKTSSTRTLRKELCSLPPTLRHPTPCWLSISAKSIRLVIMQVSWTINLVINFIHLRASRSSGESNLHRLDSSSLVIEHLQKPQF